MTGTGSTGKILGILDLFTEMRPEWTPEELMARLGYARPTLYRYLKTLREAGFLSAHANSTYTLGPRVTELDYLVQRSDPLIRFGTPALEVLTRAYPCSALLVRWYGRKLLCVASLTSMSPAISSYRRGRPMPLARGAISRAILAWLPRRQQVPLIEENMQDLTAIGLGESTAEVLDRLRQVRRTGYALARGEVTPGVLGVAAPILDHGGLPIAALCTTNAASGVDAARLERIVASVASLAREITETLSSGEQLTLKPRSKEAVQ